MQEIGCVRHWGSFGVSRTLICHCTCPRLKVPMALSDEERRRLEELERELAAAHPDLAWKLQSGFTRSRAGHRVMYGVLVTVAGFAVLVAGIITDLTIIG